MSVNSALNLIRIFTKLQTDIQFITGEILLIIAEAGEEGISISEIAEKTGQGLSTVSRHVAALGKRNRHGEDGFNLIKINVDPHERRRRVAILTNYGELFINSIKQ